MTVQNSAGDDMHREYTFLNRSRRTLCMILAVILLISATACGSESNSVIEAAPPLDPLLLSEVVDHSKSYAEIYRGYSAPQAKAPIVVDFTDELEPDELHDHRVVLLEDLDAEAIVEFEVPTSGLYQASLEYLMPEGRSQAARLELEINGERPFTEADQLEFPRMFAFVGEADLPSGERYPFQRDGGDNEIRPDTEEIAIPLKKTLQNAYGIYGKPYLFELEAGDHELTLRLKREQIGLMNLTFEPVPDRASAAAQNPEVLEGVDPIMIQAESLHRISDLTIFPTRDNASVDVMPSDPESIRLNTMGLNTWKYAGQTATWRFSVEAPGWYQVSFRARQDVTRGMNSGRILRIDGEIPFKEAELVRFPFANDWQLLTLGDGNGEAAAIYLEGGEHTISLEATTEEISDVLRELQRAITELNGWYREIIMVTGSNPDADRQVVDAERDYNLDQKIPGLIEGFESLKDRLELLQNRIDEIGGTGNAANFISEVTYQLEMFIDKPYRIPTRLSQFSGNISSLASLMSELREQPLELDYLLFTPYGQSPKAPKSGFFEQMNFRLQGLISSFSIDYSALGTTAEETTAWTGEPLRVWVSVADLSGTANTGVFSGRDQAEVLRTLVDNRFTPVTNVPVAVSLVPDSAVLVQATMAGMGPDVAVFVGQVTPAQLAMRGALTDLSQFATWEEDTKSFYPSAITPFRYEGGVYAMPETQSYDMMFYRKDIFENLGLELPDTWDEFYALLPELQQVGMQAGIYQSDQTFASLLYQRDGSFYNEGLTKTTFDTAEALDAFRQWTGLYVNYSLPLSFDFFNRFRTGEMPVGIVRFTNANYLSAGAPELDGLWDFVPVPGIPQEDGTIDRSVTADSTAGILLADSKYQEEGYEFLRWWTGADAQIEFAASLEQIMGPSARYPTANREAFETIAWTTEQSQNLQQQWADVIAIPPVPGNYQIQRNLNFAFRSVVYQQTNPRETLNRYNNDINEVISRKRLEFGLTVEGGN